MKEVKLPSGAILKITLSPFAISRNLYQAVLEEAKGLKFDANQEIDVNIYKDLFCTALASKKIEACLDECMKRVLYKDVKVTSDTWEPVEARDDYLMACFEVAKENIEPFMKSLYAQYSHIFQQLVKGPA